MSCSVMGWHLVWRMHVTFDNTPLRELTASGRTKWCRFLESFSRRACSARIDEKHDEFASRGSSPAANCRSKVLYVAKLTGPSRPTLVRLHRFYTPSPFDVHARADRRRFSASSAAKR